RNLEEEFKEIKGIPNPDKNASNSSNATGGFGELGRNFEFMMLKLAQLETLCELQQVEIESLKKTVKGLAEHVDHEDSVVSMVQKDEGTRLQEAQHALKRVLTKHVHQRATKEFHPKPPSAGRPEAKPDVQKAAEDRSGHTGPLKEAARRAELLLKRKTTKADAASLDSSLSNKDPVELAKDLVEARTGDAKSLAESTADAYEDAKDKVAFIAQTTIDTVEMAVQILLKGFTDWDADCVIKAPTTYVPEWSWEGKRRQIPTIALDFGRQWCWVSLMN
ncbi:unnamed protein product, partial [Symbiodinium necroappetens]